MCRHDDPRRLPFKTNSHPSSCSHGTAHENSQASANHARTRASRFRSSFLQHRLGSETPRVRRHLLQNPKLPIERVLLQHLFKTVYCLVVAQLCKVATMTNRSVVVVRTEEDSTIALVTLISMFGQEAAVILLLKFTYILQSIPTLLQLCHHVSFIKFTGRRWCQCKQRRHAREQTFGLYLLVNRLSGSDVSASNDSCSLGTPFLSVIGFDVASLLGTRSNKSTSRIHRIFSSLAFLTPVPSRYLPLTVSQNSSPTAVVINVSSAVGRSVLHSSPHLRERRWLVHHRTTYSMAPSFWSREEVQPEHVQFYLITSSVSAPRVIFSLSAARTPSRLPASLRPRSE